MDWIQEKTYYSLHSSSTHRNGCDILSGVPLCAVVFLSDVVEYESHCFVQTGSWNGKRIIPRSQYYGKMFVVGLPGLTV